MSAAQPKRIEDEACAGPQPARTTLIQLSSSQRIASSRPPRPEPAEEAPAEPESEEVRAEKFRRIEAAIDEIRSFLVRDGGDCKLVAVEGNKVKIQLTGACVGCQLASVTVGGIQMKLMAKLGFPVRVIPVPGPVKAPVKGDR
ncbi:NifU family protein [Afifella sp. IM 167]|uniref:NifU family protein n=1 Tax=Afifella sp. IM 167 TaxID=2033586 RepID=UPI001CCC3F9D|nr:NifU family protein [Afifella sp. IM 167]MBZ8135269.1 hypothetical protein [Afifella sp. IM 167]